MHQYNDPFHKQLWSFLSTLECWPSLTTTNPSITKTPSNSTTAPTPNPKLPNHPQPRLTSPSFPPTHRKTMTTETEEHMLVEESPIVNTTNRGQPNSPLNTCTNTEEDTTDLGFDYSKILVKSNPNTPSQSPATTPGIPSWTYQSIEQETKMKLEQLGKSLNTVAKLHHNKEFMEMAMGLKTLTSPAWWKKNHGQTPNRNCHLRKKEKRLKTNFFRTSTQYIGNWVGFKVYS